MSILEQPESRRQRATYNIEQAKQLLYSSLATLDDPDDALDEIRFCEDAIEALGDRIDKLHVKDGHL